MDIPEGMSPIAHDGEMVLYADEERENGVLVNTRDQTRSEVKWLQVFFKWGNFRPIDEESEE